MENNQYKDLPIEIIRRYSPEELDDSFNTFITNVKIKRHLYYNKRDKLRAFSTILINSLLSNRYLNLDSSHSHDKKTILYEIFYNGLLEFYKNRIVNEFEKYEKTNM